MGAVLEAYDRRRSANEIRADAAQLPIVQRLDALNEALAAMPKPGGLMGFFRKRRSRRAGSTSWARWAAARPC